MKNLHQRLASCIEHRFPNIWMQNIPSRRDCLRVHWMWHWWWASRMIYIRNALDAMIFPMLLMSKNKNDISLVYFVVFFLSNVWRKKSIHIKLIYHPDSHGNSECPMLRTRQNKMLKNFYCRNLFRLINMPSTRTWKIYHIFFFSFCCGCHYRILWSTSKWKNKFNVLMSFHGMQCQCQMTWSNRFSHFYF